MGWHPRRTRRRPGRGRRKPDGQADPGHCYGPSKTQIEPPRNLLLLRTYCISVCRIRMREKNDLGRRWQSSRHLATGDPVGRLTMLSPPVYDLYTVKARKVRAVGPAKKVGMALDSESCGELALGLRLRGPASAPVGVRNPDSLMRRVRGTRGSGEQAGPFGARLRDAQVARPHLRPRVSQGREHDEAAHGCSEWRMCGASDRDGLDRG